MTQSTTANNNSFNINSIWSIFAVVLMPVIGGEMFIVQPGFVQGLVEYGGFTEQEAGYLVAVEMTGFALTTVVLIFLSQRINWRWFMAGAMAVTAVGNVMSTMIDNVTLYAIVRFIVGLSTGGIVSLGFTSIGLTAKADRNFGFAIMASMIYGAIVFESLPLLFQWAGVDGLLYLFAGLAAFGLIFVSYLPTSGQEHTEVEADAVDLPIHFKVLAVVAMLCYFLAQGAVWAYIFLFGTSAGLSEQDIASGLTLSQFTGIIGAFAAGCHRRPLHPFAPARRRYRDCGHSIVDVSLQSYHRLGVFDCRVDLQLRLQPLASLSAGDHGCF